MYLEKLKIKGFKSFADRSELIFLGEKEDKQSLTVIVGPNGSGKSNIADAVRWVLGEQSIKSLRGKKSEDVIFSGSDKKGRLSMAEVSLFLNNEGDKKNKAIQYSEFVLTRRLYRNGDSEYLINNARARLTDIQILLAKANFGQKTYSVIGQGTVENFLNSSLAERKDFFDEATGVKHFQIKRDESLNKLRNSHDNLNQVCMLLSEIEPRLNSLTRQVNKLKKRKALEQELKDLQIKYYLKTWHELNNSFAGFNEEFLEVEKVKLDKERKMENLNQKLDNMSTDTQEKNEFEKVQNDLNELYFEKEDIIKKIARLDLKIETKLEAKGRFDLSWLVSKKEEIISDIQKIKQEINNLENDLSQKKEENLKLKAEKDIFADSFVKASNELLKIKEDTKIAEKIDVDKSLNEFLLKLEEIKDEVDVEKIKQVINNIKESIAKILNYPEKIQENKTENNKEKDYLQEKINQLNKSGEELEAKINQKNLQISAQEEKIKLLIEKKNQLNRELTDIENKLKQQQNGFDFEEVYKEKEFFQKELQEIEEKISDKKQKINEFNLKKEQEKERIFSLQKNIQELQNEINDLTEKLNELKIKSTRCEAGLENLEADIREDLGGLKEIKENRLKASIDIDAVLEKINKIKRQLELIGGIDPEVENEYEKTKDRYEFLSNQVNDLNEAIKSLEKIIRELDLKIKERFDKKFKMISEKFEQYFKVLFNGGVAKIEKVINKKEENLNKNDDNAEQEKLSKSKFLKKHNATGLSGVEIKAVPPGKKIKSISMLSGGERALTAIALLCAIISSNPAPFVILDEVDAALDEANSQRIAKILDDLSDKTQFIVITHNHALMSKAGVLYGVTMQDDGTSKLLSVKLENVRAAR